MAETVVQDQEVAAGSKPSEAGLSTKTKPKTKRHRKPPSKQNGTKLSLGHGRSADPKITLASFAEMVRRRTRNGTAILNGLMDVLMGIDIDQSKVIVDKEGGVYVFRYRGPADIDQKLKAMQMLLDRGWGKAVERILVEDERRPTFEIVSIYGPGLDPLTNGELKRLRELPAPKAEEQQQK